MAGQDAVTWPSAKRCPTGWLIGIPLLSPALVWAYTQSPSAIGWTSRISEATGGLVSQTWQLAGAILALTLLALRFGARLSAGDVGLKGRDLLPALAFTAGLWVALSVAAAVWSLFAGGNPPVPSMAWSGGASSTVGKLLGQLFGNALLEEVVWRGFLLSQLLLLWQQGSGQRSGRRGGWWAAAIFAAAVFALSHVPMDLAKGAAAGDLVVLLGTRIASGLLFTAIWFASRNLLIAVGAHALSNVPVPLVEGAPSEALAGFAMVGSLCVLLAWNRFRFGRAWPSARSEASVATDGR